MRRRSIAAALLGLCRDACLGAVMLVLGSAPSLVAQEAPPIATNPAAALSGFANPYRYEAPWQTATERPSLDPAHPPTVLILKSGRTIVGSIRGDQRGYHVETGRTSLYITFDYVKLAAADLQEAHRKLADSIQDASFERDLLLGRWCFENGLLQEAADHFRGALKGDPTNPEARQMLVTLERGTGTQASATIAHHASIEAKAPVAESLSQLSPRSVREYVTTVQPLLLSRCGNTRCHGAPEAKSFRLERVRIGPTNSRPATARNLAAVLSAIDAESPPKSPLLKEGLQAHGGSPRTPLDGPAALVRQERLRRWVIDVSSELRQLSRDEAVRHVADGATVTQKISATSDPQSMPAAGGIGHLPVARIQPVPNGDDVVPADGSVSRAQGTGGPTRADHRDEGDSLGPLTDPFDPAEFNQQHQR